MNSLIQKLIVAGEPRELILDYLDSTLSPTIDGFYEYKRSEQQSLNAQVRWEARSMSHGISTQKPIDGSGVVGLMSNLK